MPGCHATLMRPDRARTVFGSVRASRMLKWLAVYVSLIVTGLLLSTANAEAASYTVTINSNFQCPTNLRALDNPANQIVTSIPSPTGNDGVIGFVLKVYQTALYSSMAYGYCAVRSVVEGPLMAGLLLLTVIFGITFMLGMTKFSIREAMIIVFKMALVLMFAMNAQVTMAVVFKFFLSLSTDLIDILNGSGQTGDFASVDKDFEKFANYFNDPANECAGSILFLFTFIMILFPVIGTPLIMMIITFKMLFVRAVLGFLTALGSLSLLMATAPLFIAFALFKSTAGFFQRWLKSIISYSLQMTLVFAIFWACIGIFNFYDMFAALERSLSMMDNPAIASFFGAADLPRFCTPCEGFKFTGGVGFDKFTCGDPAQVIGPGQHAPKGSGSVSSAIFTSTLKAYAPYLLTNVVYLLILLWGVMEMIIMAPTVAFALAGDNSSMSLGGRVGRSGGPDDMDDRYGFNMHGIDRRMDNFAYGFRFGYDPNFRSDIKAKIRDTDPTYLKPQNMLLSPLERFNQGIKVGASMATIGKPATGLAEALPEHLRKQNEMWDWQNKAIDAQNKLNEQRGRAEALRQQHAEGKISSTHLAAEEANLESASQALDDARGKLSEAESAYYQSTQDITENDREE